ncbi:MAG: hypothetical protein ABI625_15215 [bacterium]
MTMTRIARAVAVGAACLLVGSIVPRTAVAQATEEAKPLPRQLLISTLVGQLGIKTVPGQPDELNVGASFSGTLVDPAKLAALGGAGMHAGARVSVMRIGADKLRVEADEMEPVALTKKLTLRVDEQGRLSAVTP